MSNDVSIAIELAMLDDSELKRMTKAQLIEELKHKHDSLCIKFREALNYKKKLDSILGKLVSSGWCVREDDLLDWIDKILSDKDIADRTIKLLRAKVDDLIKSKTELANKLWETEKAEYKADLVSSKLILTVVNLADLLRIEHNNVVRAELDKEVEHSMKKGQEQQ